VYVTPAEGMMIRAGQHVDPQGKVYHPYLVGWAEFWDVSIWPSLEEKPTFLLMS
jgi:ESCRT-I complex subunit TSG101